MLATSHRVSAPSARVEELGELFIAVLGGVVVAAVIAAVLQWRNLRGSFALPFAAVGYIALFEVRNLRAGLMIVTAGVLGAVLRMWWRRKDIEAGGDQARRAREARTVRQVVRSHHERSAIRAGRVLDRGRSRFALGVDQAKRVVWQAIGRREGTHSLLIGATGAGKTTTMRLFVSRHLEAGCAAVVIDPKGDPALVEWLRTEADRRLLPFWCFSLDRPEQAWNPLASGSPSERADKLIAAEEWTEPHYKRLYQRYLLNVFTALDRSARRSDLASVVELLNVDELNVLCRELDNEQLAERIGTYAADLGPDERRDLSGLRHRLALLAESEHGPILRQHPEAGERVDLLAAISAGGVVCFSLNSSRYPETAKLLGAAVLQDLKAVVGQLEARPSVRRPAVVCVDEFAAFGQDHVLGLFQRARSAGLSLVVATQELADLRRVDPAFQDQVLGNVATIVAHRQNVPESAELVAEIAGTREVWVRTFHTDDRWTRSRGRGGETGEGTRHVGREFLIAPDTIKQLGVGEAVLVQKNPHRASRVRIYSPPTADPAGTDGLRPLILRQQALEQFYGTGAPEGVRSERVVSEPEGSVR